MHGRERPGGLGYADRRCPDASGTGRRARRAVPLGLGGPSQVPSSRSDVLVRPQNTPRAGQEESSLEWQLESRCVLSALPAFVRIGGAGDEAISRSGPTAACLATYATVRSSSIIQASMCLPIMSDPPVRISTGRGSGLAGSRNPPIMRKKPGVAFRLGVGPSRGGGASRTWGMACPGNQCAAEVRCIVNDPLSQRHTQKPGGLGVSAVEHPAPARCAVPATRSVPRFGLVLSPGKVPRHMAASRRISLVSSLSDPANFSSQPDGKRSRTNKRATGVGPLVHAGGAGFS